MRFSLFYNCDVTPEKAVPELYAEIEAQAVLADRLGFDAIWLAEHHFEVYGKLPNPLLYLARLSGLTKRIGLGTAVVEAPLYNPLRLAEDAALLDQLSQGRLRLGIGSGARNKPQEFARFGVGLEEKGQRTLEATAILQQAFADGLVDYRGDFFNYEQVVINPRPIQSAQELIWLAASDSTVEYAAQRGYGLLIPRVGLASKHHELIERYRAASAGQVGQAGQIAQLRFVYVAESEREAHEQTRRIFARYASYDCGVSWDGRSDSAEYRELAERMHMAIGSPDQVYARLREWQQQYGFDELICQVYAAGTLHSDALRSLELLAKEVIPRFQSESA